MTLLACNFLSDQKLASTTEGNGIEAVGRLNAFLHGEIAASQAYRMSTDRMDTQSQAGPYRGVLRQIQEEHELAAESLRQFIADLGGKVLDESGSWGPWAGAVKCSSPLFTIGGTGLSALECLLHGEQGTLEQYVSGRDELDRVSRQFIEEQLVSAQHRHVRMLRELLGVDMAS